MGEIGKVLPKLLWPVFDSTLLELQISFAKTLVPSANVFVNVYNYADQIKQYIEKKNLHADCTVIEETEVLDIGGAIHNLAAKLNYEGNLLILNGDQFLVFSEDMISKHLPELSQSDMILFSYQVETRLGYNQLVKDKLDFFTGVQKNNDCKTDMIETYTGMSLLNLTRIEPRKGESNFFDSVANPLKNKILIKQLGDFEYWDFGTLERYTLSHFNLLKNQESLFGEFLKSQKAFRPSKPNAYCSEKGINLSGEPTACFEKDIVIRPYKGELEESDQFRIIFQDQLAFPNLD